jgi:hypothetical protein
VAGSGSDRTLLLLLASDNAVSQSVTASNVVLDNKNYYFTVKNQIKPVRVVKSVSESASALASNQLYLSLELISTNIS